MACCAWEDFEAGVIRVFGRAGIEEILIDWPRAKIAWDRHHATPSEFANVAIGELKKEGDYLFTAPRRK